VTDRASGTEPRRRRTWYRRQLRRQRAFGFAILVAIIVFVCWKNVDRVFSAAQVSRSAVDSIHPRSGGRQNLVWPLPRPGKHPGYVERIPGVYPYSVVPGGIKNSASLREIAARDRAVSQHYSRFDYSKAHLVRVTEPREVYVSYRIRDTIFWTRKKIRLPAGELLLTDGKITARAKCGNQVSDMARPEVSDQEPEEDILDQPVALVGPAPFLPVRPGPPGFNLPIGPPPLNGNGFGFPLVSLGGAPVGGCRLKDGLLEHCHPHKKPVAPEPGTLVLIGTGLAMVMWCYRRSRVAGA
jgi:PEP-CTERM motif